MRHSEWPVKFRPPLPAELARGLPMPQSGGKYSVVRGTLQPAPRVEDECPPARASEVRDDWCLHAF